MRHLKPDLPETRKRKSKAAKRRWADPEMRRKMSEKIRALHPPKPQPPPPAMKPPKPGVRGYTKHHLTPILRALKQGIGAMDKRGALAKAMGKYRSEIVTGPSDRSVPTAEGPRSSRH
jgi:hypothetical protein